MRSDLGAEVFAVLADNLFARPVSVPVTPGRGPGGDLFGAVVAATLERHGGLRYHPAPGPLISPDLIVWRPGCGPDTVGDSTVVGVEIKKLQRRPGRRSIPRSGGIDFNSSPPTPRFGIDGPDGPLEVPARYLFVLLEPTGSPGRWVVGGMVMCAGRFLDTDGALYRRAVDGGDRRQRRGLGSFGDGMDRCRPMLVFPNPLSLPGFDRAATYIAVEGTDPPAGTRVVGEILRTDTGGVRHRFVCLRPDRAAGDPVGLIRDPFGPPGERRGGGRGRFRWDPGDRDPVDPPGAPGRDEGRSHRDPGDRDPVGPPGGTGAG